MPTIVTCPDCQRQLRVPDDLLGKKVKCPDCKVTFTAASPETDDAENDAPRKSGSSSQGVTTSRRSANGGVTSRQEPEYDEDHPPQSYDDLDEDEDRPRGGSKKEGWRSVRRGLSLMIYGIYVQIGGVALFLLCVVFAIILAIVTGAGIASAFSSASAGGSGNAAAATASGALLGAIVGLFVGYGVLLLAQLANFVLSTTGQVFFLKIPDKRGTGRRSLAIAVLSLWGAGLLALVMYFSLSCLGGFVSGSRGSGGEVFSFMGFCFDLIAIACNIAWFFVFMFFLRSIALAMGNNALARQLVTYMIAVPVSLALGFFAIIGVACIGGAAIGGMMGSSSGSGQNAAVAGTGLLIIIVGAYGLFILLLLALWIWYIVLLHQTRGAIRARYSN